MICGTPNYIDPELLNRLNYSFKSDVFSLGSIFFNILTGKYLYPGRTANEML
jgi:serine/threonine protein kinase